MRLEKDLDKERIQRIDRFKSKMDFTRNWESTDEQQIREDLNIINSLRSTTVL